MSEHPARHKRLFRAAAVAILVLHLGLLVKTAIDKSITSDEPFHIARGASALFSGDFRMSVAHPPLQNLWNALPLLFFDDLQLPFADPSWRNPAADDAERKSRFANLLLWARNYGPWRGNNNPLAMIFWCRSMTMVLSLALGVLILVWAERLFGPRAGLFALGLYAFSPTVLAHACLVTTDIGSALFISLFALTLAWYLEKPAPGRLLLLGLTFGLAQLTKFTAILLVPLMPLAMQLSDSGFRGTLHDFSTPRGRANLRKTCRASAAVFAVGAVVIWAGYGFQLHSVHRIEPPPTAPISHPGSLLKNAMVWAMAAVPLPPRDYYYGLSRTLIDTEEHPHALYFWGRLSHKGWWYYYPLMFLIKEPTALLLLLALGLGLMRREPRVPGPAGVILPVLGLGMVLFFMFLNAKNIGIRHLLPVYPLLFLWLGRLAEMRGPKLLTAGVIILAAAYAGNGVATCPDYLIHFNILAGGTEGGLQKSVVGEDWGQDVPALARFIQQRGIVPIYYNAYGTVDPRAYGVIHERYRCEQRKPGWYAINLVDLRRPMNQAERSCYNDFLRKRPEVILNHTIYVYHLTAEEIHGSGGAPGGEMGENRPEN